jgi:hypothetical protein
MEPNLAELAWGFVVLFPTVWLFVDIVSQVLARWFKKPDQG